MNSLDDIKFSNEQIERLIREVFRCSICLNIYEDPVNIRNCLHKFCRKCIEEYQRRIKKECVVCRQFIETRRHMRDDNNMREISKSTQLYFNKQHFNLIFFDLY